MQMILKILPALALISLSACQQPGNPSVFNGTNVGGVAGGLGGALVGSQLTRGAGPTGHIMGTLGGAAVGALGGALIGSSADSASQARPPPAPRQYAPVYAAPPPPPVYYYAPPPPPPPPYGYGYYK